MTSHSPTRSSPPRSRVRAKATTPSSKSHPPALKSRLSNYASQTLEALSRSIPPPEWAATRAWLNAFFPFQLNWLLDWERFSLTLKARQIGASHSYGAAATLWAILGEPTTVISTGQREAFEVLDKAQRHARVLESLGSKWAHATLRGEELRFASGGRIIALPATSGGRSYSGNVILDEFGYHSDPEGVWDGASATAMLGWRMRVLSTPNGVGNLWHQLWSDPDKNEGYRKHAVTIDDARADGYPVDDKECWKLARGDARVYDQLFRCKFLDNDAQYIPTDLIDAASKPPSEMPSWLGELARGWSLYAGLDVGRTANLTVLLVVLAAPEGTLYEVYCEVLRHTSTRDIHRLADFAMARGCKRLAVDATGMGAFPAEAIQEKHGEARIEAVTFSQPMKETLATLLYEHFSREKLKIRRENAELRDDFGLHSPDCDETGQRSL